MKTISVLILILGFTTTDAYKFLVISHLFGHSHTNFMGKLSDILTEAGHDVTVILPLMDPELRNKTGIKLTKKVHIYEPDKRAVAAMEDMKQRIMSNTWDLKNDAFTILYHMSNFPDIFSYSCEKMVFDDQLITWLKAEKFDAGLSQAFSICGLAFMDYIGIPSILATSSTYQLDYIAHSIGEPIVPSYVPTWTSPYGENMNFWQRIENTIGTFVSWYMMKTIFDAEMAVFKKRDPNFKSAKDVIGDSTFVFTNNNHYLNFAQPIVAKNIPIGGITANKMNEPLNEYWNEILDRRQRTVHVSFGSMTKSKLMPDHYKKSLISVMASMPNVTFIWKYEEPTKMVDHLDNVVLAQWLPQTDLLADPRISLFITHGGLGSTIEVAYNGRPTIIIPLFAEQTRNAEMLARHGGGIRLYKDDLANTEKLNNTINEILNNKNYTLNAMKLADLLKSAPVDPRDLFVRHCELGAKMGRLPQLNPHGRQQSFIEYFLLDIILFFISIFVLVTGVIFYSIRKIIHSRKTKRE